MKRNKVFSRKLLAIPYSIFMILFVVVPLLLIVGYAFTNSEGHITLANLKSFFKSTHNINTLLVSVFIGMANTAICLVLGYPAAYFLAKKELGYGKATVLLFVMPMWINFVLRTAATRDLLYAIGINGGSYPFTATMIGMVYNYLPFVILPLYTTISKLDKSLIEASYDLGANKAETFVKTIIPMSMPGIVSAASMVFMPTMSSFVISDIMGERKISLIGNSIQLYFDQTLWHMGSLVALIMLVFILGGMFFAGAETEENPKGGMW